jgi:hypothetical protein
MSKYFEFPVIFTYIYYWTSTIVWLKALFSWLTALGNHKSKLNAGILTGYRKVQS